MPRIICQIVENFQQADGSIKIPEVLRPIYGWKKNLLNKINNEKRDILNSPRLLELKNIDSNCIK